MQIAYVLTDNAGQIKDRDMLDLYDGYLELALNTKLVTQHQLMSIDFTHDDIFCGHVQICRLLMRKLKVEEPFLNTYPPELKDYLGRNIKIMKSTTFKKLLIDNQEFCQEYFVKPVTTKAFTGSICLTLHDYKKIAFNFSDIEDVYVSNAIKIGAEFRVYIYNGEIKDCFRYYGDDWSVSTPVDDIKDMVSKLDIKNYPIFFSMDVGINSLTGKTVLIELNDGYALGNYGLCPKDYALYSSERWKQITKGSV